MYATKDIARGAPLFLALKDAQNEAHLIERGFVPRENIHDGAFLFLDRDQTIHYFREKFLSGKFNRNYYVSPPSGERAGSPSCSCVTA